MKCIVNKNELNEAIQQVSKAITSRSTIPILLGIHLELDNRGLVLTASDTEITIQRFIPLEKEQKTLVELHEVGSIVLPAKIFVEIVRKLPHEQIEIETSPSWKTRVRSGSVELQINGLDPDEFPSIPALPEQQTLHLPSDTIRKMIRQTSFAVSANESTPVLTGISWSYQQEQIKLVATDRHRLASRQLPLEQQTCDEFQNIVISGKILNELNKLLPDQNSIVDVVIAENQVLFRMNDLLFYTRILDGMYPDTSKIIPQTYKTELVLSSKLLLDAMERCYILSREERSNIVYIATVNENTIEVSSSMSELGKITEHCAVHRFTGDSLKISFNAKFMLDVLKIVDSEKIVIGFNGAMSPIIVKPDNEEKMTHLILPYRTIS